MVIVEFILRYLIWVLSLILDRRSLLGVRLSFRPIIEFWRNIAITPWCKIFLPGHNWDRPCRLVRRRLCEAVVNTKRQGDIDLKWYETAGNPS